MPFNEDEGYDWQELTSAIPQEHHDSIKPILEQYNNSYKEVAARYSPYRELDPQQVQQGIGFLNAINNPDQARQIAEGLRDHYKWEDQPVNVPDPVLEPQTSWNENHPGYQKYQQLEDMFKQMSDVVLRREQEYAQQQASRQLDNEISTSKKKFNIDPNDKVADDFITSYMYSHYQQNMTPQQSQMLAEKAADTFINYQNQLIQRGRQAPFSPTVLSGGGGVPSNSVPREELNNPKKRLQLAEQMFKSVLESEKGA